MTHSNLALKCFIPRNEAFCVCLYVGFHAQRNLCDKKNVLFHGHPHNIYIKIILVTFNRYLYQNQKRPHLHIRSQFQLVQTFLHFEVDFFALYAAPSFYRSCPAVKTYSTEEFSVNSTHSIKAFKSTCKH